MGVAQERRPNHPNPDSGSLAMKIDAERLRTLRTRKGLSQTELARRAGIHARTVRRLENEPEQCEKTREDTVHRLVKALAAEPGHLTGDLPLPKLGKEPTIVPMRSPIRAQILSTSRLAYDLVSRRYGVTASEIINLAPLFFTLLAEGSLKWRREKLEEVEEGIGLLVQGGPLPDLMEMTEQEEMSVDNADVFGEQRHEGPLWRLSPSEDNPFAAYLHKLDPDSVYNLEGRKMRIDYGICREELSAITNGSPKARMCLEAGLARVSEIPEELMVEDAGKERAKWLEDRIPEDYDESAYYLEYYFGPIGPVEKEGADQ